MRDNIERLVLDMLRCLVDIQMEMSSRQLDMYLWSSQRSGREIKIWN